MKLNEIINPDFCDIVYELDKLDVEYKFKKDRFIIKCKDKKSKVFHILFNNHEDLDFELEQSSKTISILNFKYII